LNFFGVLPSCFFEAAYWLFCQSQGLPQAILSLALQFWESPIPQRDMVRFPSERMGVLKDCFPDNNNFVTFKNEDSTMIVEK
jgi:hypothetical protein